MKTAAGKQRILESLENLPDDATVEEAIERLYFLAKVQKGLEQLDDGHGLDHQEVKRRLGQ